MCVKNKPVINERLDYRVLHAELLMQVCLPWCLLVSIFAWHTPLALFSVLSNLLGCLTKPSMLCHRPCLHDHLQMDHQGDRAHELEAAIVRTEEERDALQVINCFALL